MRRLIARLYLSVKDTASSSLKQGDSAAWQYTTKDADEMLFFQCLLHTTVLCSFSFHSFKNSCSYNCT